MLAESHERKGEILVTAYSQGSVCQQGEFAWQFVRLIEDESGQDMIEYALIAATVGLGTVAGVNGLASSVANYMNVIGTAFDAALGGQV
jgi:pilus assembly protein Flp/PilA